MEDYYKVKALSKSQIKFWRPDNPIVFWNNSIFNSNITPFQDTDYTVVGQLAHCLFLEPEKFLSEYEISDEGGKSRKNKKWQKLQETTSKKIITTEELEKAKKMISALSKYEMYRQLFDGRKTEMPILWYDKEWDIECKAKLDCIKNTTEGIYVIDYKTTSQIDMITTYIDKGKFHYDVGFYSRAVQTKFNTPVKKFYFVFQSTLTNEENLIKVKCVEGPHLEACEMATDIAVRQIKEHLDKWNNKDINAWLPEAHIEKWEVSPWLDKTLASFEYSKDNQNDN